jgi:hypothetical protein
MEKIPYKTVRRIFKNNVNGEVSRETCLYVQSFLSDLCKKLAVACNRELQEINKYRRIQKLPELKRIHLSIFEIVVGRLFKSEVDFNDEETGQHNIDTVFSKADAEVV